MSMMTKQQQQCGGEKRENLQGQLQGQAGLSYLLVPRESYL